MADTKLIDLPNSAPLSGDELVYLVQGGVDVKAELQNMPISAATQTALDSKQPTLPNFTTGQILFGDGDNVPSTSPDLSFLFNNLTVKHTLEVIGQDNESSFSFSGDSADTYNRFSILLRDNSEDLFGEVIYAVDPETGVTIRVENDSATNYTAYQQNSNEIRYNFISGSFANFQGSTNGFRFGGQNYFDNYVNLLSGDSTNGYNTCEINLKDNSDNLGSIRFKLDVDEGISISRYSDDLSGYSLYQQNLFDISYTFDTGFRAKFSKDETGFTVTGQDGFNSLTFGGDSSAGYNNFQLYLKDNSGDDFGTVEYIVNPEEGLGVFFRNGDGTVRSSYSQEASSVNWSLDRDLYHGEMALNSVSKTFKLSSVGLFVSGEEGATPVSGLGTRLMWIPEKKAFRAGTITGDYGMDLWDNANIGEYSFAVGQDNLASGQGSFVGGARNQVLGDAITVFGDSNAGECGSSFIAGNGNEVYGGGHLVTGNANSVNGNRNICNGSYNYFGEVEDAAAVGSRNDIQAFNGICFGSYLTSKALNGVVVGNANDISDSPVPNNPQATDRIFQVGNGGYEAATRSNALTILRDGKIGFGVLAPTELMHLKEAGNFRFGTTTGTKIGTATNQKIGFWNSIPVIQPAAVANATGGVVIDSEARTQLNLLLAKLRTIGIIAT
ncbi:MAG: hypothetical protein ACRC5T_11135 [Cetobacterium sp.]